MSETVLTATSGRATGSANARRQRATDSIPAVVGIFGLVVLSLCPKADFQIAGVIVFKFFNSFGSGSEW